MATLPGLQLATLPGLSPHTTGSALTRDAGVTGEVVGAAIRHPDALDPPVGREALGVPAVARVVRHLALQVLPEPQAQGIDPHGKQVLLRVRQVEAESLVRYNAL